MVLGFFPRGGHHQFGIIRGTWVIVGDGDDRRPIKQGRISYPIGL